MDVIMPQLGETVTEGTVTKWYKKVGDAVKVDEVLFDVETDKVSTEIPSSVAGILEEIRIESGVTAKVGVCLAVIKEAGDAAKPTVPVVNPLKAVQVSSVATAASATPLTPPEFTLKSNAALRLSPVVRRLAAEHQLDLSLIKGTGRDARITREDVMQFLAEKTQSTSHQNSVLKKADDSVSAVTSSLSSGLVSPSVVTFGGEGGSANIPQTALRRRIAQNMTQSWTTVPHVFQMVEADFYQIDRARNAVADEWKAREGFILTYLPFVMRALSIALAKFPKLNASFNGDSLTVWKQINIGVAVDLNFEGLMVPVVKDVPMKSLTKIAREVVDLATRARAGKLRPDDLSGGTYTLSNNGSLGTHMTTPIINTPQVAILSTDSVRKKPVVIQSPEGDSIGIRPIGTLGQSLDHRAVDGAYGGAFLSELKKIIETRDWLQDLQS